jgi:hypothetical protein
MNHPTTHSDFGQTVRLVHGDRSLARRLELAEGRCNAEFVEARACALPHIGAEWISVAGALAMFDGVGSPCTQTFGLGLFDHVTDDDLSTLEGFFVERGSDTFHEICTLADISLLGLLSERGYRPIELSSVLFRPLDDVAQGGFGDGSIQVRQIHGEEHQLWAQTAANGWADAAPGLEDLLLDLGRINPHRLNTRCFLAEKQGQAIAAAALFACDRIAVLAGACTVPKWRKQGAQLALLEHRLRVAADCGCDIAMVVTQPGSNSQRNAERHGFHVAYTRTKWQRDRNNMV